MMMMLIMMMMINFIYIFLGEIKCLQSELERNSLLREEERRGAIEEKMQHEKEIRDWQLDIRRLTAEAQASLNNNIIHEEDREKWQREREALNSELGLKDGEMGALKNRMSALVKENEKLSVLIGEKDGNLDKLFSEIRSLGSQMQEAKAEMEQWRERVTDIEHEKKGLLERVKHDCENQKIREIENAEMADILKMKDVEIEKNSKHIEELVENLRLQDISLEKLKTELKEKDIGMSAIINNQKIKETEREAEERQKELKLKGELKKKENELERLKGSVEELNMEMQHMSHLLQEKDSYLEKIKKKVADLEETGRETQDEMEWWKKRAGDVAREKEVLIERVEKHVSVEQERDELTDRLIERDKEIKIMKTNEQDMVGGIEKMKEKQREQEEELKRSDRELEELRSTVVNLIKEKNEQEKWKMQLEQLKKEKTSLEEKRNKLEESEKNMREEISVLKVKICELDREKREVQRKVLEQKDQAQIQTVLLKDREGAVDRLRETLEQKEKQENEELVTLKEKLKETELVQEKQRNTQKEYDQKLQVVRDTLEQVERNVKELETKNKNLTQEADVARKNLVEQLRELETKSRLLQESEENIKELKLTVESGENEKEHLKRTLKDFIELRERKVEEEQLRLKLEQQILDLGEDLRRKNGAIDALKEKTDLIIKQKEDELKEAKRIKDAVSTEMTKLRDELTVLSGRKEKAETMLKELNIENKKLKDGLTDGLKEMVTLKELLEESHSEGKKLRKILEEKKNEIIKGRKEEVRAAREETEDLKIRVQILQKENQELQAQLWIREENDIKMNWEVKELKKMELETHKTLKMTLGEDVKDKNDQLKKHEMMKEEKNKRQYQLKDNSFEHINEKLKEDEREEINRKKKTMEEQEIPVLRSKAKKKKTSLDLVKDEMEQNRETGAIGFATDILPKGETELKITPEFKENARHLLGELGDAQMKTNLEKNIPEEKIHCQFQENFTIVNAQTKRDFQMKESHSQTETTQDTQLQAEVYDLKKEADELRKDRDRIRTALEKNEAMLIHYQEKAHQLEKKVQVRT